MLAGNNWHKGVLGIVAAKVAAKYNLPTIIASVDEDFVTGSGRSVGDINLHEAILQCSDLLDHFGGHKSACGVNLQFSNLAEFARRLDNYMQTQDTSEFESAIEADCEAAIGDITINNVEELQIFQPFGSGCQEPTMLLKNVFIRRARAVGNDKNHLSCFVSDGVNGCSAIMFNVENIERYIDCNRLA